MSAVVWKYEIPCEAEFEIEAPPGEPLSVQVQAGKPRVWILVDPDARPLTKYRFIILPTGGKVENTGVHELLYNCRYVGTFQLRDGSLVFHLFLRTRR